MWDSCYIRCTVLVTICVMRLRRSGGVIWAGKEVMRPPGYRVRGVEFVKQFYRCVVLCLPFLMVFLFCFTDRRHVRPVSCRGRRRALSYGFVFTFVS